MLQRSDAAADAPPPLTCRVLSRPSEGVADALLPAAAPLELLMLLLPLFPDIENPATAAVRERTDARAAAIKPPLLGPDVADDDDDEDVVA